jgi:hypothetical protein
MKTDQQIEKELKPLKSLFENNEYSVTNQGAGYYSVHVNIAPEVQVEIRLEKRHLFYLGMESPSVT